DTWGTSGRWGNTSGRERGMEGRKTQSRQQSAAMRGTDMTLHTQLHNLKQGRSGRDGDVT
ncbi:hypothetical protein BCR44DRAFT_1439180, partial [Catenaria anguillulae PL171]